MKELTQDQKDRKKLKEEVVKANEVKEDKELKKLILELSLIPTAIQNAKSLSLFYREIGEKLGENISLQLAFNLKERKETLERGRGK